MGRGAAGTGSRSSGIDRKNVHASTCGTAEQFFGAGSSSRKRIEAAFDVNKNGARGGRGEDLSTLRSMRKHLHRCVRRGRNEEISGPEDPHENQHSGE